MLYELVHASACKQELIPAYFANLFRLLKIKCVLDDAGTGTGSVTNYSIRSAAGGNSRSIDHLLAKPLAAPSATKRRNCAAAEGVEQAPVVEAEPECLYEVLMAAQCPYSGSINSRQSVATDLRSLTLTCQRSPKHSTAALIGMESQLAIAQQAANAASGVAEIALGTSGVHATCVSEPRGQGSAEGSAAWSLLRTLQQETDVRCSGGDAASADSTEQAHLQITLGSNASTAAVADNNGDTRTTRHAGEHFIQNTSLKFASCIC